MLINFVDVTSGILHDIDAVHCHHDNLTKK